MTKKYTLLIKSDEGDGFFHVPINIDGDEEEGYKVARIMDAMTVARDLQRERACKKEAA